MSHPAKSNPLLWAEIDLGALRKNLRAIRATVKNPSTGVLAIVKAEAYGHGMVPVSRALWKEGVRFFGVANIDEALSLRKALPRAPILVLGCFHPSQIPDYIRARITPTLSTAEDALFLHQALKSRKFPVHVKIDTGMGRLGLSPAKVEDFFRRVALLKSLDVQGVYTHFPAPTIRARLRRLSSSGFSTAA